MYSENDRSMQDMEAELARRIAELEKQTAEIEKLRARLDAQKAGGAKPPKPGIDRPSGDLENIIKQELTLKILQGNSREDLAELALAAKENLLDGDFSRTAGVFLRRYIAGKLLADGRIRGLTAEEILDYRPGQDWNKEATEALASQLFRLSGKKISTANFRKYLTDTGEIQGRSNLYHIGMVLGMDYDTVCDFMLVCGAEPFSARDVQDMAAYCCFRSRNSYTWQEVQELQAALEDALQGVPEKAATQQTGKVSTRFLHSSVEEVSARGLPKDGEREAFLACLQGYGGAFLNLTDEQGEDFIHTEHGVLPGFSRTRMKQFQRLLQYGAVLYPCYQSNVQTRKGKRTILWRVYTDDGFLSYSRVLDAACYCLGWDWQGTARDTFTGRLLPGKKHVFGVNSLLGGGKNVKAIERRDVLLMCYFLFYGIFALIHENSSFFVKENQKGSCEEVHSKAELRGRLEALQAMTKQAETGDEQLRSLDAAMGRVMKCLKEYGAWSRFQPDAHTREMAEEKATALMSCFDDILRAMNYHKLYLLSPDRFFLLSLLREDLPLAQQLIAREERLHEPVRILFLSTDDRLRGPLAAYMMREVLRKGGRESEFEIASAGLSVGEGTNYHAYVGRVLDERGITLQSTAAQGMTLEELQKYQYIYFMDASVSFELEDMLASHIKAEDPGLTDDELEDALFDLMLGCAYFPEKVPHQVGINDVRRIRDTIEDGCRKILKKLP